jgi:hypothetical protein
MVYLVHFERPYKHARHYVGFTEGTLAARFARHRSLAPRRRGSALLRAVLLAGIAFKVVRTWPGDRVRERQLKSSGHARRCPVCQGRMTFADAVDLIEAGK